MQILGARQVSSSHLPFVRSQLRCVGLSCLGQMLRVLARANKTGHYHGFDINVEALEHGKEMLSLPENREIQKCIQFHRVEKDGTGMPSDASFDVAITTDVLHDSSRPQSIFAAVARLLKKPQGIWLVIEPSCHVNVHDQLADKSSSFKYGVSLHACLASSMSEGPSQSAGLGTLGLSEGLLRQMARQNGFSSLDVIKGISDPFNSYYVLKIGNGNNASSM